MGLRPPVKGLSASRLRARSSRTARAELVPSATVQAEAALLAAAPEKYLTINGLMGEVLAFLHRAAAR